ncbi:mitotic-spindle organizing gamma-tubulin ring associated-domain-containing protein [Jimgerdemannia flammicorona]|uniref:Mitotic-spindle organizing protein 1 n=1 Tax=Jimgerdemannia flammicorona TaxID=994334 RepID=A0A433D748_9FUNG|nr:mitotic-spindle organizing gamma-tubulin ring associated-domain-containing protein [Jimgerdemannia flammicorona]
MALASFSVTRHKPHRRLINPSKPPKHHHTMDEAKLQEARETIDILYEMSTLLNTGLDRESLALCVSLCESSVNPEALAVRYSPLYTLPMSLMTSALTDANSFAHAVIKELRRESAALKVNFAAP